MEQQTTDGELIARVVARDELALAALYDRYAGVVYSVVVRILRERQAAEEILQDIFFQLWNNAAKFDESRGSLAGWLVVSARNRAISRLRRRNPSEGEELPQDLISLSYNLETIAAREQLLGRVRTALEQLADGQREAIELAYFKGMTHSEIAQSTGEPLGTIKTRLRSAVEALRDRLK